MDIAVTTAFSHHTPVDFIVGAAQRLEAAGFSTVWVPEHVVFFPEYESSYPYSADGKVPGDPDGVLDPFSALTYVAAHTSTLRLGTGVCLVPQRQPVYTAKMVADLDYLSGGRVSFGVGVGWLEEEFGALGMDFRTRGRRANEYLRVMKALWGADPVTFTGDTITITNAQFNPKPVQSPHPPIFVGGESDAAMRRVASLGDGWYGFGVTPDTLDHHLGRLDQHLADAGRRRDDIRVTIGPNRNRVESEWVEQYAAAGVDEIVIPVFAGSLDSLDRRIEGIREMTGLT